MGVDAMKKTLKWIGIIFAVFFVIGVVGLIFESDEAKEERIAQEEASEAEKEEKAKQKEEKKKEKAKQKQEEKKKKENQDADREEKKAKQKEEKEKADKKSKEKEKERLENRTVEDVIIEEGKADETDLYEGELTIDFEPGTMWSENSLMGVVHDMFENLPISFEDNEIDSVVNVINVEMTDSKGNEEVKPVITFRYTREDYESLNYENFKTMSLGEEWRILNESDGYFIHPGIRANLKDKYTDNLY